MALDTIVDETAADPLLDEFTAYVATRIGDDVTPESFFRSIGLAIRDVLDECSHAPSLLRDAPEEYVIALSAYAPDIASSLLDAMDAQTVRERYTEFFSER